MIDNATLIRQAESLVTMGEKVISSAPAENQQKGYIPESPFHDFRISALSFLSRVFGQESTHYQAFRSEVTHPTASRARRGLGILAAAARELQGDWLQTTRGAIVRDTLADLLRLGRNHYDAGRHSAVAVVCGAVLEKLLRDLALAKSLPLHNDHHGKAVAKKGVQLAGELYKKKHLARDENKSVIAWLESAETASSASGAPLSPAQAKEMLDGVGSLLARTRF